MELMDKRHRRQSRDGSGERTGKRTSFKWTGAHESTWEASFNKEREIHRSKNEECNRKRVTSGNAQKNSRCRLSGCSGLPKMAEVQVPGKEALNSQIMLVPS